ncbi:formyltransferase family protein [Cytobacillus praedii]
MEKRLVEKDKLIIIPNPTDDANDTWQKSLKKYSIDNGLSIVSFSEIYSIKELIFFSLECNKILNPSKFITTKLYNIHFSCLPKYKGMFTSVLPILNGESKSGVTLHNIDEGIDTGDIIDQIEFNIDINDTARDLYFKYNKYAFQLFKNNIENILYGKIQSYKQPTINSTYFSKEELDFKNIIIDLNQTAFQIHNQLRGYIFKEYQLPIINNSKIIKSVLTDQRHNKAKYLEEKDDCFIISGIDKHIVIAYKDLEMRRSDV